MNEIKCPKCGTVFQISETDYESIVKQIRDKEFETEIKRREEEHLKDKENAIKLAKNEIEKKLTEELNSKTIEINELKNQVKTEEEKTKNKLEKEYTSVLNKQLLEINNLKHQLELKENEKELAIKETLNNKEKEIIELNNKLQLNETEFELKEKNLKENFENNLKLKEEEIAYYKDFKAKQSTKMIGESLEQHCNYEFNRLRPLFPKAYFEKDNDAKTGSKGDFIFRDYEDNTEFISIMFEMKNEADATSTKHKNEDFLKELDKDRKEKNCEYAVLVSMLEMDNDLYNEGIVDVSHKHPKMYIIRPQFFIPIITLLRNAALNSLSYKKELELVKNQNIDISHFEENILQFKDAFSKNYKDAQNRFDDAIDQIDKVIDVLSKIKNNLQLSGTHLNRANNKLDNLTIKKLTHNSPTMAEKFEELKQKVTN